MAGAIILGYEDAIDGTWAGYGADGWHMRGGSTLYSQLPAGLTGVTVNSDADRSISYPGRNLMLPPGVSGFAQNGWVHLASLLSFDLALSGPDPVVVSLHCGAPGGIPTGTRCPLAISLVGGGSLASDAGPVMTAVSPIWWRVQVAGPATIRVAIPDGWFRVCGVLFDLAASPPAPGRLCGFQAGRQGLI